jgi:GMP synthase-like glutamine amidotransferase
MNYIMHEERLAVAGALRVHCIQHVSFEGPAAIRDWALDAGCAWTATDISRGDRLPEDESGFDLLVVMGGPMSVNDEDIHPWLRDEKRLVRRAIESGKAVLGVCLGAQLIASAMGERVYPGPEKEIGWWPVRRVTSEGVGDVLPESFVPLHWHGETFDLPEGAVRLIETEVVPNQAFQLGRRVIGLQFHIEATPQSVQAIVDVEGDGIGDTRFQQPAAAILDQATARIAETRPVLNALLSYLTGL